MLTSTSLLINITSPSSWLWRMGNSMPDYPNASQLKWLITIKLWNWLDMYMTAHPSPPPRQQEIPSAKLWLDSLPINAQMYSQPPMSVSRLWTSVEPLPEIWFRICWNKEDQPQRLNDSSQAFICEGKYRHG